MGPRCRARGRLLDRPAWRGHCGRGLAWIGVACLLGAATACSFSKSSESSSDSSKGSSNSSSSSSGNEEQSLQADVERYTAAFAQAWHGESHATAPAAPHAEPGFLAGLGDLSRRHGISDWESDPGLWEAVGRGLAQSGIDAAERRATVQALAGGDSERERAIERGCEPAR